MSWHLIYTKSRYEKAVAEKLTTLGVEVYCPLLRTRKQWSDRWKWVEEPLFRSYCFVEEPAEKDKVLAVPGVVRYIYYCGRPAVIRNNEMQSLQDLLSRYTHESIESGILNAKDKIIIRSGALSDKEAEVVHTTGHRATLYLEDMGLKVTVDLRKNLVEKVG
ncbi:transcription termination/antitermination protein NusG [Daejeonella lutea]|uniref:Transcription antitermination factor NusG n=1 Tax=Daejeonella lutea TaxID=572036 RepID=A0A1T5FCS4_9SPHI|nr:UpxY family transcription antiterminator [Daejeonella lutea]SKB93888.1 Transcription antitermination factor NusG [Daejeonella lutea]